LRILRGRVGIGPLILGISIVLLLVLVLYPFSTIAIESFNFEDAFSWANYQEILSKETNIRAFKHSLEVAALSTIFSTIIGTFLAWLVGRTDLPGRSFFRSAFVLPFIIPPFIGAIAWLQILGPYGYISRFLMDLTESSKPLFNIYGRPGIVLVMILHGYPLVYLTALGGLERMNPELEEAAQVSGARIFSVMKDITLPLMAPIIAAGAVLVFIADIANFGIPAVMGLPKNYFVLTTKIYDAIRAYGKPNHLAIASGLSIILAIVAGVGLLLQRSYLRGKEYTVISGKSMQPNIVALGKHKYWLLAACLILVFFTTIAPLVAILLTSLVKAYGLAPVPSNFTLNHYRNVFLLMPESQRAIRNSLLLAGGAATIIALLGSLIAYICVKTQLRFRHTLDFISSIPYAVPGTVVALAMILAWLKPIPVIHISIYNTIWILLVAYIARYLTFGVQTTAGSLAQVHSSLEEAALISGANWLQSFRDVVIPLIIPGLFAGWFLVFMPCLRELTISVILWSVGNETIGVTVYNLQEQGSTPDSAALATAMLAVLFIANFLTRKVTGGRFGY
jgi:iron(III) transport system permease protein